MDDGSLIEQVSGFPALFNEFDKRYKSKLDKEAAWRTTGAVLHQTPEACEQRWTVIRNRYTELKRELRAAPSGSAATDNNWPYFDSMGFLDPFSTTRRTATNFWAQESPSQGKLSAPRSPGMGWDTMSQLILQPTEDTATQSANRTQTPVSELLESAPSTSSQTAAHVNVLGTSIPRKSMQRKKNSQEAMLDKMSTCFENLNKRAEAQPKQNEDIYFATSLAQDMTVLTPVQKIRFEKRVYELLETILEEDA